MVDFSPRLLRYVTEKWGDGAVDRLQAWRSTELEGQANRPSAHAVLSKDELQLFNRFWNKLPYYSDKKHWGKADYWATPIEPLASNGADSEDYAIAKYFSLKDLGVPPESLRITYVRSLKINEAHMVLAYYPAPDADPYILDNMTEQLVPASERDHLDHQYILGEFQVIRGIGCQSRTVVRARH